MCFKRTTPAVRRCKNQQERCSRGREIGRRPRRYGKDAVFPLDVAALRRFWEASVRPAVDAAAVRPRAAGPFVAIDDFGVFRTDAPAWTPGGFVRARGLSVQATSTARVALAADGPFELVADVLRARFQPASYVSLARCVLPKGLDPVGAGRRKAPVSCLSGRGRRSGRPVDETREAGVDPGARPCLLAQDAQRAARAVIRARPVAFRAVILFRPAASLAPSFSRPAAFRAVRTSPLGRSTSAAAAECLSSPHKSSCQVRAR